MPVFFAFLLFIVIPPSYYGGTNNAINNGLDEQIKATFLAESEIPVEEREALDLYIQSVIDTDVVFTDSNDPLIQRFLDESGIGFSETFGIVTTVGILSPDGSVDTQLSSFGIAETSPLSLIDSSGVLRDLDTIQIVLDAQSKQTESSINVWGKLQFYEDDNIVPNGEKFIWGSGSNTDSLTLSIVDNLSFEFTKDSDLLIDIAEQEAVVENLRIEYDRRAGNQDNTGRFVPDPTLPALQEQINIEMSKLDALKNSQGTIIKRAFPPSFSEQEKRNFTFTLKDEGQNWVDQQEVTYRAVLTDVHAEINGADGMKKFDWLGQEVIYELDLKVDGAKRVILDEDLISKIEVLKSDNTIKLCGSWIYQYGAKDVSGVSSYQSRNPPNVTVIDSNGDVLVEASHGVSPSGGSSGSSCSTFTGIPRGSELKFNLSTGESITVNTGGSQENFIISASPSGGTEVLDCYRNAINRTICDRAILYQDTTYYSNFGFGNSV